MSDRDEMDWMGLVLSGDVAYAQVMSVLDARIDELLMGIRLMLTARSHAPNAEAKHLAEAALKGMRKHYKDLELVKAYVASTQ